MKSENTNQETGGELAPPICSALVEALDDGQEVEMYKLDGIKRGYVVRIHGDCWHESNAHKNLDAAIKEVAEKYSQWKGSEE